MRVVIRYADGAYSLRRFTDGEGREAYRAADGWLAEAVEVPEYLVEAWAQASIQAAVLQPLLRLYDRVGA